MAFSMIHGGGSGYAPEQVEAGRKRSDWHVIKSLLPFLWPPAGVPDALNIKVRVLSALACIVSANPKRRSSFRSR